MKNIIATLFVITGFSTPAHANISENELEQLKGFTILGAYTVTGFRDVNGKKSDSFEGCEFDRRIILNDSYSVMCSEYRYQYAYRPKAIMFSDGRSLRMLVSGQLYKVTKE
jgi:hypothetical protein